MKQTKRLISFILAVMIVLALQIIPTVPVNALTWGDYSYSVSGGVATITGYTGNDGNLVIPSTINGYTVTGIKNAAFSDNLSIVSVSIPNSITVIGAEAFRNCSAIKRVYITNLTNWCKIDFRDQGSNPLRNGAALYVNGSLLTKLTIPSQITVVRQYAFQGCSSITEVVVPDRVTSIEKFTFTKCMSLKKVTVGSGVASFGHEAFDGCASLEEINLSKGLQAIGSYCFNSCSSLTEVTIPDSVEEIDSRAFAGCSSLKSITIPGSVKTIGYAAFEKCSSLKKIQIPSSVTEIGDYAFYKCNSLKNVTIPAGVTSIGIYALGYKDWEVLLDGFVIKGYRNSRAEQYAEERGITFVTINNSGSDKKTNFSDIKKTDWYYKNGAISFVYNKGLFAGTSDVTFGPGENMTRGMFVTVLGRLHGVSATGQSTKFSDVKQSAYYSGYVKWANRNGIVTGTSADRFSPNDNITREQICTMMERYCNYAHISLRKINAKVTFRDAAKISKYARSAVSACQQGAVINGEKTADGHRFRPQGNATRAEVATIMMNFCNNYI